MNSAPEDILKLQKRFADLPLLLDTAQEELAQAGAHLALGQWEILLEGLTAADRAAIREGHREYMRESIGAGLPFSPFPLTGNDEFAARATYRSPALKERLQLVERLTEGGPPLGKNESDPLQILTFRKAGQAHVDRMQLHETQRDDEAHERMVRETFRPVRADDVTAAHVVDAIVNACGSQAVTVRRLGNHIGAYQPVPGGFTSVVLLGPFGRNSVPGEPLLSLDPLKCVIVREVQRARSMQALAEQKVLPINLGSIIFGINMYAGRSGLVGIAAYIKVIALYSAALTRLFEK